MPKRCAAQTASGKVTFAYLKFRGEKDTGEMHFRPTMHFYDLFSIFSSWEIMMMRRRLLFYRAL